MNLQREGIKNEEGCFIEKGSFEWYLHPAGGGNFAKALARCIQLADQQNLVRLSRGFPQMVAAYQMRSWFEAPKNFPFRYDALKYRVEAGR